MSVINVNDNFHIGNEGEKQISIRKFLDLKAGGALKGGLNDRRIVVVNPKTQNLEFASVNSELKNGYQLVNRRMLLEAIKRDNPSLYTEEFLQEVLKKDGQGADDTLYDNLEARLDDEYLKTVLGKTIKERSIYCLEGREIESFSKDKNAISGDKKKWKLTLDVIDALKADKDMAAQISLVERSLIGSKNSAGRKDESLEVATDILQSHIAVRESMFGENGLFVLDNAGKLKLAQKWKDYVKLYATGTQEESEVFQEIIDSWGKGEPNSLQLFCDLYNHSDKRGTPEFGLEVCREAHALLRNVFKCAKERVARLNEFKTWFKDTFAFDYGNESGGEFEILNAAFRAVSGGGKPPMTLKEVEKGLRFGTLTANPFKEALNEDILEDLKQKAELGRQWFGDGGVFKLTGCEVQEDENHTRKLKFAFGLSTSWEEQAAILMTENLADKNDVSAVLEKLLSQTKSAVEEKLNGLCLIKTSLDDLIKATKDVLVEPLNEAKERVSQLNIFMEWFNSEFQKGDNAEKGGSNVGKRFVEKFAYERIKWPVPNQQKCTIKEIKEGILNGKWKAIDVKNQFGQDGIRKGLKAAEKCAYWFTDGIAVFKKNEGEKVERTIPWKHSLNIAVVSVWKFLDSVKEVDACAIFRDNVLNENEELSKFERLVKDHECSPVELCEKAEEWLKAAVETAKKRAGELKAFKEWFGEKFPNVPYGDDDNAEFAELLNFKNLIKSRKDSTLVSIEQDIRAGKTDWKTACANINQKTLDNMLAVRDTEGWVGNQGVFVFNEKSQELTLSQNCELAFIHIAEGKLFKNDDAAKLIFANVVKSSNLKSDLKRLLQERKNEGGIVAAATAKLNELAKKVENLKKNWFDPQNGPFQVRDSQFVLAENWKDSSIVLKMMGGKDTDEEVRKIFGRLLDRSLKEKLAGLLPKGKGEANPLKLCDDADKELAGALKTAQKRAGQLKTFRSWVKSQFAVSQYGDKTDFKFFALNACPQKWLGSSITNTSWVSLDDVEEAIRDGSFFSAYQSSARKGNVLTKETEDLDTSVFGKRLTESDNDRATTKNQFKEYESWFGPQGVFTIKDGGVQVAENWGEASVVKKMMEEVDEETRKIFLDILSTINVSDYCKNKASSEALKKDLNWIKALCDEAKNALDKAFNEAKARAACLNAFREDLKKTFGIRSEDDAGYKYLSATPVFLLPGNGSSQRLTLKKIESAIRKGKLSQSAVSKLVDVNTVKEDVAQNRWISKDDDESCIFYLGSDMPILSENCENRFVEMAKHLDLEMNSGELEQFKALFSRIRQSFSDLCDRYANPAINASKKGWKSDFCAAASQILTAFVKEARAKAAQEKTVNDRLADFRGWVKETFGVSLEGDDPVETVCRGVLQFQCSSDSSLISPDDVERRIKMGDFSMGDLAKDENALADMKKTINRIRAAAKGNFDGLDRDVAGFVDDDAVNRLANMVHGDVKTVKSAVVKHICEKLKAGTDKKAQAKRFKDLEFSVQAELKSVQEQLVNVVKGVRISVKDLLKENVYGDRECSIALEDAVVKGVLKDQVAVGKLDGFLSGKEKKVDCKNWFEARVNKNLCELGKLFTDKAEIVKKLQELLSQSRTNVSLDSDVTSLLSANDEQLSELGSSLHLDQRRLKNLYGEMRRELENQLEQALLNQVTESPTRPKDWLAHIVYNLESVFFQKYQEALIVWVDEKISEVQGQESSDEVDAKFREFKDSFKNKILKAPAWQALFPGFNERRGLSEIDVEKWLGKPFLVQMENWLKYEHDQEVKNTRGKLSSLKDSISRCRSQRGGGKGALVGDMKRHVSRYFLDSSNKDEASGVDLFSTMVFKLHQEAQKLGVNNLEPYEDDVQSAIKEKATFLPLISKVKTGGQKFMWEFVSLVCQKIKTRKEAQEQQSSLWEAVVVKGVNEWLVDPANAMAANIVREAGLMEWVDRSRDAFFADKALGKDPEAMAGALKALMDNIASKLKSYGFSDSKALPENLKKWFVDGLKKHLQDLKVDALMSAHANGKLDPLSGQSLTSDALSELVEFQKKQMLIFDLVEDSLKGIGPGVQKVVKGVFYAMGNAEMSRLQANFPKEKTDSIDKASEEIKSTLRDFIEKFKGRLAEIQQGTVRIKVKVESSGNVFSWFANKFTKEPFQNCNGYLQAYFKKNDIVDAKATLSKEQEKDLTAFLLSLFSFKDVSGYELVGKGSASARQVGGMTTAK